MRRTILGLRLRDPTRGRVRSMGLALTVATAASQECDGIFASMCCSNGMHSWPAISIEHIAEFDGHCKTLHLNTTRPFNEVTIQPLKK